MKLKLNHILYFICIAITYLNNYEVTFAVWTITLLVTIKKKYSLSIIKYISVFILILSIALLVSVFHKTALFLIIRDFTYLSKPIIGLLVGYQLCKSNNSSFLKLFIYTGVLIAIIHLVIIFIAFVEYKTLNVNVLREKGGYFSDYEIYTLILLLFYKKFNLEFSKEKIKLFIFIVGFSSFLYLARTNMIQFVILFVGIKGYYELNKQSLKIISTIIISVLIGYFAIVYINPKRQGKGIEAFLYKIKIAPEEAFKTKINKEDWKDFNDNYRSFENIITVRQVSSNGSSAVMFGEGLGSRLNLGRKVFSNDGGYVQYIPYVHNGFMTVFLKSGILGVILLLYFIYILFRQKKSSIKIVQNINYLLVGTSVFLIVSNWVFLGLYLKLDNKSIIIGALLALREIIIKDVKNTEIISNE